MRKIDFNLDEKSRCGKFYIRVNYEGGDADTRHPVEWELPGIDANNYLDHLSEIERVVDLYTSLKDNVLSNHWDWNYDSVLKEYGQEMVDAYEDSPNDPQCDFQYKCYIDDIYLIKYDAVGNRYVSYT